MRAAPRAGVAARLTQGRPRMLGLLFLLAACALAAASWAVLQQVAGVPVWAKALSSATAALVSLVGGAVVAATRERFGKSGQTERELGRLFAFWRGRRGPRVRDVIDPYQLGVHEAAPVVETPDPLSPPPYVGRTVDRELEQALRSVPFLLLVGASTAGKSRSAFEAMRRVFPNRLLLVPIGRESLPELDRLGVGLLDAVIWLDELDRYLGADGLTAGVLERLTSSARVTVLATMRATVWHEYTSESDLRRVERDVLRRARRIRLERRLDEHEQRTAERLADDRRIASALTRLDRYGLAEYLAAGPALLEHLLNAAEDVEPVGYAVVRAAVDWQRAGLALPVSGETLLRLYPAYLGDPHPSHLREEAFRAGLDWARRRLHGSAALLIEEADGYRAFDYLVDHYAQQHEEHPIPDEMWRQLLATVIDPEHDTAAGVAAYRAGQHAVAEAWWRRAAEAGEAEAAHNLGLLYARRGEQVQAEVWWQRAAKGGSADAAYSLGLAYRTRGRSKEAENWCRRAAEAGSAAAAHDLGRLFLERGRLGEAETWWRLAAEAGDSDAAYDLGGLLKERGRADDAEEWYRRAADAGHVRASYNLGLLLWKRGRLDDAEDRYRRAADAGDVGAAYGLGLLFERRRKPAEAESWYARAAEAGHVDAAYNLGLLLDGQKRVEEAERWYRRAAEAGDADASFNLALLFEERRRPQDAAAWYRRAAEAGSTSAANNLGLLLEKRGSEADALAWFQRAASVGDTDGAYNLGMLFQRLGELEQAEVWLRRAAEAGSITAADSLGGLFAWQSRDAESVAWDRRVSRLLHEQGKPEAADWYLRAAWAGDPDDAYRFGAYLAQQGRLPEAEAWFGRAAEDGHAGAAFEVGMLLFHRGKLGKARAWWVQAAKVGNARAARQLLTTFGERVSPAERR